MPQLPIQQIVARSFVPENGGIQPQQGAGVGGLVSSAAQLGAGIAGYIDRKKEFEAQQRKQEMDRLDANEADVQIINGASNADLWASERVRQARESPGGLVGSTASVLKDFDAWAKDQEGTVNAIGMPKFRAMIARKRGELNEQLYGAEMKFRNDKLVTDFDNGLDGDRRLVYANPGTFNDALARRQALAQSLAIPEEARQKLQQRASETLAYGAAQSMAENTPQELLNRAGNGDPAKAEKAVQDDPVLSRLTPEAFQHVMHVARTELSRRSAEGRYDIAMRTKDVQGMVMAGVSVPQGVAPTVEEYTRLHGASGPAMWQQEVGNYLQIGGAIQSMRTASFAERQQIAEQQKPVAGAGFAGNMQMYEATMQAKQMVEKQITADPAAYALATSPRVQQAAAVMQRVLNDPKQGPEDRAAVVDFYARTASAEQERLGVGLIRDDITGNRPRGPKLLTNQQANAISDQFNQGGADAAQLVQGLEQAWGKNWPRVYSQLAADNKLPAAALVIPNMPNDASRSRMAEVARMKPDELKGLLAPGDVKDLHEQILSNFDQAQRTFTAQGASGNQTLLTFMEQAEKLAQLYRSQGKSVKESAKQAYTETMGHAYQWGDTYRVPNQYDLKAVRNGADATVEGLVKAGGAQVFAGAAPQKITDDALRARSMWITNSDETGLELRLRGADGGVYAVHGADGRPITKTWAELTTQAKTAQQVDNSRAGNEEWMRRRQQELNPVR